MKRGFLKGKSLSEAESAGQTAEDPSKDKDDKQTLQAAPAATLPETKVSTDKRTSATTKAKAKAKKGNAAPAPSLGPFVSKGPSNSSQRDYYHHVIPRFILRYFDASPHKMSRAERNRAFKAARGLDPVKVKYYDIASGTLDTRSLSNVYGITNLYRDVRNIQDVDHVERKLSSLEQLASNIIQDLHKKGTFSLSRKDKNNFRKFLFVMHYRHELCSKGWFKSDHPDNIPAKQMIDRQIKLLGLHSATDLWLHCMRYYLDTPHNQIVQEGIESLRGRDLPDASSSMNFSDLDISHMAAMTYLVQDNGSFQGVLKAAPGEEFVLGHNSFGLWEGTYFEPVSGSSGPPFRQIPQIHRLFILSPEFAILWRSIQYRPERNDALAPGSMSLSDLLDIKIPGPEVKHAENVPQTGDWSTLVNMLTDVQSRFRDNDQVVYPVVQLTEQQTYAINFTVLANAGHVEDESVQSESTQSLTFSSDANMLRTLKRFTKDPRAIINGRAQKYIGLLNILSSRTSDSNTVR